MLSSIWSFSPYGQGCRSLITPSASSRSYSGGTGGLPARSALRLFHSASDIWMCAASRSMMPQRSQVASVAYTAPRKPFLNSSGKCPVWSRCACVTSTKSSADGATGISMFSNSSRPCSMPQSTSPQSPPTSSSVQLPVTSWLARMNVSFIHDPSRRVMILSSLYARSDCRASGKARRRAQKKIAQNPKE